MRIRLIAAHAATIAAAVLGGLVNRASYFGAYGFGCFYARQPYGSACADVSAVAAVAGFLKGFAATAAFIYAIWAIVFLFRRRKKADAGGF